MAASKVEEYKRKLEEYEAKQAEAAKLFNPKELARKASEIRTVKHPELGEIRYGVLVYGDFAELVKYGESREQMTITMLWLMLRKAYPDLTREDVANMPFDVATKLLTLLLQDSAFLKTATQAGKTSKDGLKPT